MAALQLPALVCMAALALAVAPAHGQAPAPAQSPPASTAPDAGAEAPPPPAAAPVPAEPTAPPPAAAPVPAEPPALPPPSDAIARPPPSAADAPSPSEPINTGPPPYAAPGPGQTEASLPPAAPGDSASYSAVATATRSAQPSRDVPASVSVIDRAQIERAPSLTTDSLLRTLPSAATFRRSTSLVADPSSQGLNLRGLGPSGVSRTLVLLDGVPANDPFGGWVYWRALPRLGLDRIEVVHGGGSALYGSAALGGVVQLLSRSPFASSVDADASYASLNTIALAARGSRSFGKFGASLEGEWLRSDGYRIVAPDQRGAIDGLTPSEHGNVNGRFALEVDRQLTLNAAVGFFREVQNGGTEFTTAEVTLGSAALSAQLETDAAGRFDLVLFGHRGEFGQVRARIAEGRESEERASRQQVPSGDEGGSFTWTSPELNAAGTHTLLLGLDARHIDGESIDRIDPAMRMPDSVVRKAVRGQQWLFGVFAQDLYRVLPRLDLQAALRADAFRSYDGRRVNERANDSQVRFDSDARSEGALSPRLGALLRATPFLNIRASGYRAFRAPTLNELYRSFQVGTILTAANDRLKAETVLGGELGLELLSERIFNLRVTGFVNVLDRPITNVTLEEPLPDGSMRQRQNLGRARVHGLEVEASWQLTRQLSLDVGYTWARSEVTDAGPMRALVGKRLAQDPEHRASAALVYDDPRYVTVVLALRAIGQQYEDDLNMLAMDGYALLDASLSRRLVSGIELFVAAENLLDSEYLVGRAGVDTIGQPFSVRVGIRLRTRP